MEIINGYNLVKAIDALPKNVAYNYISSQSASSLIRIVDVKLPSGPITFRRFNTKKGESYRSAKNETIPTDMIWRLANAINEGIPFNVDRVFAGSYNCRSVLEALIAATPCFYYCYPGRIFELDGQTRTEHGHKHLIWCPNNPHKLGVLTKKEVDNMAVSELPMKQVVYDDIVLPIQSFKSDEEIVQERRHLQIQIALWLIGQQLGYRTWIAQNDKGTIYRDKPLYEYPGIIKSLSNDENVVSRFEASNDAKLIDCIWFQNGRFMPAVMEVEHSTGITSGLSRMLGLYKKMPDFKTRYVIVAPDDLRQKAINEINREQFRELDARFFPYSSVEELLYLCTRRGVKGVTQEFLDSYMESVCFKNQPTTIINNTYIMGDNIAQGGLKVVNKE